MATVRLHNRSANLAYVRQEMEDALMDAFELGRRALAVSALR